MGGSVSNDCDVMWCRDVVVESSRYIQVHTTPDSL
jgi:hypothetical protein